ncbi:MAG: hypothetical protein L6Q69_19185 [Zoogloea sp.]|nr:hypothetical protein [Zoogloea sp.]
MTDLVGVLSDYGQIQPRRAHGGIYALAGFNYQLRAYVARLVESLGRDDRAVETAGQVFLEALSDLAERTNDDRLICIQAKRTLTTATLKDAADELLAIDLFLQQTHPDWHPKAQFELIASQGSPIDWTSLPANHPAYARVQQLLADGRLHPPRIEPDPGWRAIVAVWNTLDDPYGFVRFTLDRALGRTTSAADAQRVRDDICERYAALRRPAAHPGVLLTAQDFEPNPDLSPTLEIGREITLARLRDQQYMPRPHRREALLANLLTRADLRHLAAVGRTPRPRRQACAVAGRTYGTTGTCPTHPRRSARRTLPGVHRNRRPLRPRRTHPARSGEPWHVHRRMRLPGLAPDPHLRPNGIR